MCQGVLLLQFKKKCTLKLNIHGTTLHVYSFCLIYSLMKVVSRMFHIRANEKVYSMQLACNKNLKTFYSYMGLMKQIQLHQALRVWQNTCVMRTCRQYGLQIAFGT